jgi:4-amino-4-deoxy-L-arabinose transferase-like glycosyltransferase
MPAGTAASLPKNAREWLRRYRIDWLIAAGLFGAALTIRATNLTQIPAGIHGDEAWTGLFAARILHHGWIGPYVQPSGGEPTGPIYFVAPFIAVFGRTVFAIRFPMALLGAASVLVAFATFRFVFDRPMAAVAAVLLCVSAWHVHFSRMAFPVISWPLAELIVLASFFLALRTERRLHYVLTGIALGLGVYTYNSYPFFLLAFGLFVVWIGAYRYRHKLRRYAGHVGVMIAITVVLALPLVRYVADAKHDYFARLHYVSITRTDEWKHASGFRGHMDVVLDSTGRVYADTFWRGSPDITDGMGDRAVLDRLSLALLGLGVIISLWRWRQPPYVALLLMLAVLPIAAITTQQVGMFRRMLGLTPFLAALEALPLALLWSWARTAPRVVRVASLAAIGAVLVVIAFLNLSFYFQTFPDTTVGTLTYAEEMASASHYMNDLPGDPYVYFYSERWAFDYEVRRFLAPELQGEDRSREFSSTATLSLETDRTANVAFIFLDPYGEYVDQVQRLYTGGRRHDELDASGRLKFSAYYLPALAPGATPLPGATPIPTPTREVLPGGQERDRTRLGDMERLQQALIDYQQKYQEFPTNGGIIQTFCSSKASDAGCRLSEFLDPLPKDPSGNQTKGYFYSSNGLQYAIYAYRESDAVPECDEHPEDLADLVDVMCVKGP